MVFFAPKLTPQQLAENIILASAAGDFKQIITLLDRNPRVTLAGFLDTNNGEGNTALMEAVSHGRENVVKRLIATGANVNCHGCNGKPNLIAATDIAQVAIVELLIGAGADLNAQDQYEATALINAVNFGYGTIVVSLLEARANIDIKDMHGNTALMNAAQRPRTAILERLLKAGAKLDLQDNLGCTALYRAAHHGQDANLEILIAAGADPWVPDNIGAFAFDWAIALAKANPEKTPAAARILIPAMFDVRWWREESQAKVESAWEKIPPDWRPFGTSAINTLARHFANDRCPPARVNRRLPSPAL